jgi:iron complex outermembrane receptor protein
MNAKRVIRFSSASIIAIALCGIASQAAMAADQSAPNAVAPATSGDASNEVVITSTPNLAGVVQNKSATAVFGFSEPVAETPRSLTEISGKLLDRYDIKSVYDLTTVAAGAATGSYFGLPGSANIRGTIADNYFEGFQEITNIATYPTPVEANSNVDLVRGPPSPAFGAGQIGGFLNFAPKSAVGENSKYLTSPTGAASFTYGSYNQREGTLEGGTPLNLGGNAAGVYGFVEITDSDSFYIGMHPKSQIAQFTFNTDLGSNWTGTASFQIINSDGYLKNIGWNRVTQDLIDHDQYVSGQPIAQIATPGAAFVTPAAFAAAVAKYGPPVQYVLPVYGIKAVPNPLTELNPSTVHTVTLSPRNTFITSDDINTATTPLLYLGLKGSFDDGHGLLKLESFSQHLDALNYQSYGFSTDFRTTVNEERISYTDTRDLFNIAHVQSLIGFSYRFSEAYSAGYLQDGVEIQDIRDLSQPLNGNEVFNNVFHTQSRDGYQYDNQTTSFQTDYAPFLLEDITLFNHLNIIGGVRDDNYSLKSQDQGPAATNEYKPNVWVSATQSPVTYNISISIKNPWVVPYFTYAKSESLNNDQGGALDPNLLASDSALGDSTLEEAGLKTSQYGGRLFAALDAYSQTNTYLDVVPAQGDEISSERAGGIESELRYLVTQSLGLTAAATYQRIYQINSSNSSGTFLIITPQQAGISGVQGWGGQFESNSAFLGLPTTYELHSQPNFYGSLYGTYDYKSFWGLTGGFTYNSYTGGSIPGSIKIPAYTLVKIGGYAMFKGVRLDLTISNLLDTRYFMAEYAVEANTTVLPGIGREFHLKLSKKF